MTELPVKPKVKRTYKWKRFVGRIFGLVILLCFVLFLLLRNLMPIANWILSELDSPYTVTVKKIELLTKNQIAFTDLRITQRVDSMEILHIPHARLKFHLLQKGLKGFDRIESVVIENAQATVRYEGLPDASFQIDIEPVLSDTNAQMHVAKIRNLRITDKEKRMGESPESTVSFTISEIASGHVRSIRMDGPKLDLTLNQIRHFLPKERSPKKETDGTGTPGFSFDELEITNGNIRFTEEEIPSVTTTFSLSARGNYFKIELRDIHVTKEKSILLSAKSFSTEFDAEALKQGHLKSVALHGASITLDKNVQMLFEKYVSDSTNTKADPSSQKDWQIDTVSVEQTTISGKELGDTIPYFSAQIDAQLENLSPAAEQLQSVQFSNIRLATPFMPDKDFLGIGTLRIEISPVALLKHQEIESIEIQNAQAAYDRYFRSWIIPKEDTKGSEQDTNTSAGNWTLKNLILKSSRVSIEDIGFGIPGIDFAIQTTLYDLSLGWKGDIEKVQTVEISDLTIHSPLDPFVPVLNLQSIFIRFSLAGLMRQEIEEIVTLYPIIFVGDDLFWYADELKKRNAKESETQASAEPSHWHLNRFQASYGRLVITAAGASNQIALPLNFSTEAKNISFQNLSDLQLKLKLVVPKENYTFPAYQLDFNALHGGIEFGLPPESGANNLNNTLYAAQVRWRQFLSQEVWLSVTYDLEGINGDFGGFVYGGYLNGGFSFFLSDDIPWTGWVAATNVDMKKLTDILAPENFQMTGPASLKIEVNATGPKIERVSGTLEAHSSGHLKITKLDSILAELPSEWSVLKRDLTRIGLETLRDFDYDKSDASFWFLENQGRLELYLSGLLGSRNFSVILHPNSNTPSLWQTHFSSDTQSGSSAP